MANDRPNDIAAGVSADHVRQAIDEWYTIGREAFFEKYKAKDAQKYVVIDGSEEIPAMALLRAARKFAGLDTPRGARGERSTVADPLTRLGFEVETKGPGGESPGDQPGGVPGSTFGPDRDTDGPPSGISRREQQQLRDALGLGPGQTDGLHECGICGRQLPRDLLVAAHIKRRAECDEEERRAFTKVAMVACTLGCDAFFEKGYVAVADTGAVLCAEAEGSLGTALELLRGRHAAAWTAEREPYFAEHRRVRFRRVVGRAVKAEGGARKT